MPVFVREYVNKKLTIVETNESNLEFVLTSAPATTPESRDLIFAAGSSASFCGKSNSGFSTMQRNGDMQFAKLFRTCDANTIFMDALIELTSLSSKILSLCLKH